MRWKAAKFSLFYLLLSYSVVAADNDEKPCTIHAGGKFYNLNPLSASKDYEFKSPGGHDVIVNVCRAIAHETWGSKNEDPNEVAGFVRRDHGDFSIGKVNKTLSYQDGNVRLLYKDGSSCKSTEGLKANTVIEFICDMSVFGAGRPRLVAQFPPDDENACGFSIEWKTHYACPTSESGPLGFFAVLVVVFVALLMTYLVFGTLYNRFALGLQGFDQVPRFSLTGMVYHSQQAFEYVKDSLAERSFHLPTNGEGYGPAPATNPVSHQSNVEGMQGMGLGHRDRAWRSRPGGNQQQPNPFSHQAQVGLGRPPPPKPENPGLSSLPAQRSDPNIRVPHSDQAQQSGGDNSGKELIDMPTPSLSQPGPNSARDDGGDIADIRGRDMDSDGVIRL